MIVRWMTSPLGPILLRSEQECLTGLFFERQKYFPTDLAVTASRVRSNCLDETESQLREYFAGKRVEFQLPCLLQGTSFQCDVWERLISISYGECSTYGQIAVDLNQPEASRAVGAAVGRNPISLIYPCHRVVAKSGSLTGYAGGLDRKRWLLDFEKATSKLLLHA
jgi:methylated-DNA-[protein]-cysteine S-methyltransferase